MREFRLTLPEPPGTRRPAPDRSPPSGLTFRVDEALYIPKVLERRGLGSYEPETVSLHLALLSRSTEPAFFDVGANVGVFSLLAAALTDARITAFEPVPELAAAARSLAEANGLEIDVRELALGSQSGEATLYLSKLSDSSHSLREGFRPARGTLQVKVDTLDAFCRRAGIDPQLIKLDTEATEPEVLRGARELLEKRRPWLICEALAGRTERALNEILEGLDYRIFQITDQLPLVERSEVAGDPEHRFNNWLFAPVAPDEALWRSVGEWRQSLARCGPEVHPSRAKAAPKIEVSFSSDTQPYRLAKSWLPAWPDPPCRLVPDPARRLLVDSAVAPGKRLYLTHGGAGFDRPPSDAREWQVEAASEYQVSVSLEVIQGRPRLQLWVIQYDEQKRLAHDRLDLRSGGNRLRFRTLPEATAIRLALRLSGPWIARLGPIDIERSG